ncbi:MAG: hypothetical protein QME48_04330 [bacterium]|nr:hypothetical protein [bacterium]
MGYNIEKIREKFGADFVFSNENDTIMKTGLLGYTDDVVKQVIVVLKQSLDAANVSSVDRIEFQNEEKKIIFFQKGDYFFGIMVNKNVSVDDIGFAEVLEKESIKKDEKEEKVKVALKDKKKIVVKPSKSVKEKKDTEIEEDISALKIDADSFDKMKKIAGEFLEDFAEDIINNIVSEMKLDIKNLDQSKVDEFLKRFSKASSMIIGPSQSQKMVEKILQSMK